MNLRLVTPIPTAEPPFWARDLRVTLLDLELVPETPWRLPPDPSVTLRGALGSAMMEICCVQQVPDCVRCPHRSTCAIPTWYDPGRVGSSAARPLVVRVSAPGRAPVTPEHPLHVQLLHVGTMLRPSLIVEAVVRMCQMGLGPERVTHRVQRVMVKGEGMPAQVVLNGVQHGIWPEPGRLSELLVLPVAPVGAKVRLLTPTFWSGVGPQRPPSAAELLRAVMGRVRQLAREQGVALSQWWPSPDAVTGTWREARWCSGDRFSRRQGVRVDLGGWVGVLELGPEVAPFEDLLAAAHVLGVGKGASAGRGQLLVEWQGVGEAGGE